MMKVIDLSKQELDSHINSNEHFIDFYQAPGGILKIYSTNRGIFQAEYTDEVVDSFKPIESINKPILLSGTDFQNLVLRALLTISKGTTVDYFTLAQLINQPRAYRAVANALAQNKIAYLIPCHRIIRKDGSIGGYKWGIERKRKILAIENNFII